MSTPRKILSSIERARAAIANGDLDDAERRLAGVRPDAPSSPELAYAEGELASARGDSEAAITSFLRAVELEPDWPEALLAAADEALSGLGAPDRALELAERLLAVDTEDEVRCEALLIAAMALLDGGDEEAARSRLEELEELDPEDPEVRHELGAAWLDLDEAARAEAVYRDIVDDDAEDADALHALGLCLHARGERDEATRAWLAVRALDLAAPRSSFRLSEADLEELAERTLRELPEEVRARLGNVPILIEDAPSEELVREGMDPRLLGLFTGTPLPEKSHLEGSPTGPDTAILYLRNLESACADRATLEEEVRITILHETAHFFGLEDEQLEALGLG